MLLFFGRNTGPRISSVGGYRFRYSVAAVRNQSGSCSPPGWYSEVALWRSDTLVSVPSHSTQPHSMSKESVVHKCPHDSVWDGLWSYLNLINRTPTTCNTKFTLKNWKTQLFQAFWKLVMATIQQWLLFGDGVLNEWFILNDSWHKHIDMTYHILSALSHSFIRLSFKDKPHNLIYKSSQYCEKGVLSPFTINSRSIQWQTVRFAVAWHNHSRQNSSRQQQTSIAFV